MRSILLQPGFYVLGVYNSKDKLINVTTTIRNPISAIRNLKYRVDASNYKVITRCESYQEMRFIRNGLKRGLNNILRENQQCA